MCWCRTMPNISLNEKTSTWYCYLNAKRNRWQVVSELSGYKLTLSFSCREFLQENTKGLAACFLWAESWGLWASGRGGELSLYKFTVYSFVLFYERVLPSQKLKVVVISEYCGLWNWTDGGNKLRSGIDQLFHNLLEPVLLFVEVYDTCPLG